MTDRRDAAGLNAVLEALSFERRLKDARAFEDLFLLSSAGSRARRSRAPQKIRTPSTVFHLMSELFELSRG